MTKRHLVTMATILAVLVSVVAIKSFTGATSVAPPRAATLSASPAKSATIAPQCAATSIEELEREIDVRSFPHVDIRETY